MAVQKGFQRGDRTTVVTPKLGVVKSSKSNIGDIIQGIGEMTEKLTLNKIEVLDEKWKTQFKSTKETFVKDGDKIHIHQTQDVERYLDQNKREQQIRNGSWKGEMHKVASIPPIVVVMWKEELKAKGAPNHDPFSKENRNWLIAKLNSSEFSAFRTKEGRI